MNETARMRRGWLAFLLAATSFGAVLIGCAENQGTRPADMTASGHGAAAEKEERKAKETGPCRAGSQAAGESPCWTSRSQPAEASRHEGERHRRIAEEHRAAAALRSAEEKACADVSEDDRMQSPFSHYQDLVSVQPLVAYRADGTNGDAGAIIVFREVPGLTVERLQKIIDCHLARNAAFGYDEKELAYCPLNVNPLGFDKLKVTVVQRPDGLAVKLRSKDESVAREILQRARMLVGSARCLRTPATET